MKRGIKILSTADIHNDKSLIDKLISSVKTVKPDFLIIAGDLSHFFDPPKGLFYRLLKYIDRDKIIVVPGNHDSPDTFYLWEKEYGVKVLHLKTHDAGDVFFIGIGGGNAPPFMVFEEDIEGFLEYLREKLPRDDKKIVLISHVHPEKTQSSLFVPGSEALLKLIYQVKPDLVIHGHIHEAGGLEDIIDRSKIVNVARDIFVMYLDDEVKTVKL